LFYSGYSKLCDVLAHMDKPTREHYLELCDVASSKEQDPAKLVALVEQINRLLQDKEERLNAKRQGSAS